jgi:hypothetical protein
LLDSGGPDKDKRDEYSSPSKRLKLEEGVEVEANYRGKRKWYHGDGGDHTEINKKFEIEEGKLFADITMVSTYTSVSPYTLNYMHTLLSYLSIIRFDTFIRCYESFI